MITVSSFPLTALILPLLTCGAAWAIAIWALRHDGTRIEFPERLQEPARESVHEPAVAQLKDTHMADDENEGDCGAERLGAERETNGWVRYAS